VSSTTGWKNDYVVTSKRRQNRKVFKQSGLGQSMAKLEDMEYALVEKGTYPDYCRMFSGDSRFDPVRYAMALGHNAQTHIASDQIMFIGGMGVLGNIVNIYGEEAIPNWRGTHDIDLIVRRKDYLPIIQSVFDDLDMGGKSLSVPNKYTLRGKSRDGERNFLNSISIDAYVPNGSHDGGVVLDGKIVNESDWNEAVSTTLFGVPINVLNPIELMRMKLEICCEKTKNPRKQDQEDVLDLYDICRHNGFTPKMIYDGVGKNNVNQLQRLNKTRSGVRWNIMKK